MLRSAGLRNNPQTPGFEESEADRIFGRPLHRVQGLGFRGLGFRGLGI